MTIPDCRTTIRSTNCRRSKRFPRECFCDTIFRVVPKEWPSRRNYNAIRAGCSESRPKANKPIPGDTILRFRPRGPILADFFRKREYTTRPNRSEAGCKRYCGCHGADASLPNDDAENSRPIPSKDSSSAAPNRNREHSNSNRGSMPSCNCNTDSPSSSPSRT